MADENYDSRCESSSQVHPESFSYLDSKEAEMIKQRESPEYKAAYGKILTKAWAPRMESATAEADPLEIKANEGTNNVK